MNASKLSQISFAVNAKPSEEFFSQIFLIDKLVFDYHNKRDALVFEWLWLKIYLFSPSVNFKAYSCSSIPKRRKF